MATCAMPDSTVESELQMGVQLLQALGLTLAGILAGLEFVVRYGVQPALTTIEDRSSILARIALVNRLKVVVPLIMLPSFLVGVSVLIFSGDGPGYAFRWVGVAASIALLLFSFLGTVPINMQISDWTADAPPEGWQALVKRWEFIDVFRSSSAIIAFISFVVAATVDFS